MTNSRTALLTFAVISAGLIPTSDVNAQSNLFSSPTSNFFKANNSVDRFTSSRFRNQAFNSALPSNLRSQAARNSIFGGSSQSLGAASKPFANVTPQSNLSPYLNIGGLPTGSVPNYHTQVRPQLERQQQAQQRRNTNQAVNAQSVAARAPYEVRGDSNIAPTGHAAVYQNLNGRFQNYGGYYQGPRTR